MSIHSVSLTEAEGHLADLIQLANNGEEVVITCNNGRQVKLIVENDQNRQKLFGLYQGQIQIANNFDDELPNTFWLGENPQ